MDPDVVDAFVAAFTEAWNPLSADAGAQSESQRRELAAVERKIGNFLDAGADGIRTANVQ